MNKPDKQKGPGVTGTKAGTKRVYTGPKTPNKPDHNMIPDTSIPSTVARMK